MQMDSCITRNHSGKTRKPIHSTLHGPCRLLKFCRTQNYANEQLYIQSRRYVVAIVTLAIHGNRVVFLPLKINEKRLLTLT